MVGRDIFVGVDPFMVGVAAGAMLMAVIGGLFGIGLLLYKVAGKLGLRP